MKTQRTWMAITMGCLLFTTASCASGIDLSGFPLGEPRAEVIQKLGSPTSTVGDCDIYRWSRFRMAARATMLTVYELALGAIGGGGIKNDVEWLGHDSMFCYDHDQLLARADAVH
jgi:hypothetical protein